MFSRLPSPVALEEGVLRYWEENGIFEKSIEIRADAKPFVFFEGPPTANGTPHNGHVLTRVIKDVVPRYMTMRGFRVDRKAGWDTHGLPVEVEVEKSLGIHGKEMIEEYGLEQFSRRCIESVFTYVKEWEDLTRNIGFWVNLDDAYVTYHKTYVESVWWALKTLFDRGLLYQGHKVVWWWPQGGTTLSAGEVGMGYKEVDDPAVTVRFHDASDPSVKYLAWTTTPWTLPSNVALAVGKNIDYAYCDDPEGGEVVIAVALAEAYGLTPKRVVKGSDLLGKRYTPLYDFGPAEGGDSFVVIAADHVTTGAGTGIVHTAPAFGEDDMIAARKNNLGLLQWVKPDGRFAENTGFIAGMFCKDADRHIIHDLKERGLLFKRDTIRHDYPFCWRADDDPLIQYARPAWFIRTTDFVDKVLENNKNVTWQPEHIQEGRFGDFLRNNVDWALSRERFWGTPLPIWECPSCANREAYGSVKDLKAHGATGFDDTVDEHLMVHKPWIDTITVPCPKCGTDTKRVPEVIDCWFDSGCMPFAQWGFPHINQETFKKSYPADFISEAIDQTRGWFYSLIMIATMLFDDDTCAEYGLEPVGVPRPYRNCMVLGHVCDMDGRKESKSKGNYTSPNLVFRGRTKQHVYPDPAVKPGQVGMKKDQVKGLDLGKKELVRMYVADGGAEVKVRTVPAKVTAKDAVHLNPADIAAIGLPEEGGQAWFQIPIEPPGADAFRWLFCSASPPWSNTRLSLRAIRDGQREFLIRLRNVVQFFSIYANIAIENGHFDPAGEAPPVSERADLDRWILHELTATTEAMTTYMDDFRLYDASREILAFVESLSNWYVRRSRTRFWGEGKELQDALWTLYEVLCATTRLIAPFVPFQAEAMHGALVRPVTGAPSAHLEDWPIADAALLDASLAEDMALIRELASLGLSARAATKVKVRQPLQAATIVLANPEQQAAVERLQGLLLDELNVRELVFSTSADELVDYSVKPNFKKLGRTLGKDMKACAAALASLDAAQAKAQLDAGTLQVTLGERVLDLGPDDVMITVKAKGDYQAASSPNAVVALSSTLTDDLVAEGLVRELVNRVQNLRKEMDLGYTQRIALRIDGDAPVVSALGRFGDYLSQETLARTLDLGLASDGEWNACDWEVDGHAVRAQVRAL